MKVKSEKTNLKSMNSKIEKFLYSTDEPDYEKIIKLCEEFLKSKEDDAQIWHNKGTAEMLLSKYKEAEVSYKTALKIDPNNEQYRFDLIGYALDKLGKKDEIIKNLEYLINKFPERSYYYFYDRGEFYSNWGEYEKALEDFNAYFEKENKKENDQLNNIYSHRVKRKIHVLKKLGRESQIQPFIKQAFKRIDNILVGVEDIRRKSELLMLKVDILTEIGDFETIKVIQDEILKLNGAEETVEFLIQKAEVLEKEGKYEALIDVQTKLVERGRDYRSDRAETYVTLKEYDKALIEYENLIKEYPSSPSYLCSISDIYVQKENYDAAIKYLNIVLEHDPRYTRIHHQIGQIYRQMNNLNKAAEVFQNIVNEDKDYSNINEVYSDLGDVFVRLRDFENAEKYLNIAYKNDPHIDVVLYNLACCAALQNKKEEALKFIDLTIKENPSMKDYIARDQDFGYISEDEGFKELVK
jgi:tetratricopeptide (TPR) repeat protein